MKNFILSLLLSIGCIGITTAQTRGSADEVAVRAENTTWFKGYLIGNSKIVSDLYAEDAVVLPPGGPMVRGKKEIEKFYSKDVAETKSAGITFTTDNRSEVGLSHGLAWESGVYKATQSGKVIDTGKYLTVSRKKNGNWKIVRDIWNSDVSPGQSSDGK